MITPSKKLIIKWFQAAEATGDFMAIRYGRQCLQDDEVKWSFVSHCEYDGIGGFAKLLRANGAELASLPQTKYTTKAVIRPLWNVLLKRKVSKGVGIRDDWKLSEYSEDRPEDASMAVDHYLFTENDTEKIRQLCKKQQVTVNSFLLKYLDRAVRPDIKKPKVAIPWMIPVNLRGSVDYDVDTANHVSCIEPIIAKNDSVEDIQQSISSRLFSGEHRANFLILGLGRFFPRQLKLYFIKKSRAKKEGNIGAFSNLGVWDSERAFQEDAHWYFCPPVCQGQLLGAGCVTFQNRLSLTIQAEPGLFNRQDIVQGWMKRWVQAIKSQ